MRSTLQSKLPGIIIAIALLSASSLLAQEPVAEFLTEGDTVFWYTGAPFKVKVRLGPPAGNKTVTHCALRIVDGEEGVYLATVDNPQPTSDNLLPVIAIAEHRGKTVKAELTLRLESPQLASDSAIDAWDGMKATIGQPYNPSSEWMNPNIPNSHYHTVVYFNGREVFSRTGTRFDGMGRVDREMLAVTENITSITTKVFWKPGGFAPPSDWVCILSSDRTKPAAIVGDGVTITR